MPSKQTKKRHHYVPQFYLAGFLDPQRPSSLWVYEKGTGRVFPSTPRKIAVESHYYSFTGPDGNKDSNMLENLPSEIEGAAARGTAKILAGEPLSDEDRSNFAVFLGFLLVRVPNFQQLTESMVAGFAKMYSRRLASNPEWFRRSIEKYEKATGDDVGNDLEGLREFALRGEYDISVNRDFNLRFILLGERLAPILHQMTWTFLRATDDYKFLTSDNPLVYYDPTCDGNSLHGVGFTNKHIEVTVPISRDIALLATWRDGRDSRYLPVDNKTVKAVNRRAVISASRFIFASQESEGIRRLVKKFPIESPMFHWMG